MARGFFWVGKYAWWVGWPVGHLANNTSCLCGDGKGSRVRPAYIQSTNRFSFWYTPAIHWTWKIVKSQASNVGRNLWAAWRYPNYPLLGIFFWDPKKKFLKGVVRFSEISRPCRDSIYESEEGSFVRLALPLQQEDSTRLQKNQIYDLATPHILGHFGEVAASVLRCSQQLGSGSWWSLDGK